MRPSLLLSNPILRSSFPCREACKGVLRNGKQLWAWRSNKGQKDHSYFYYLQEKSCLQNRFCSNHFISLSLRFSANCVVLMDLQKVKVITAKYNIDCFTLIIKATYIYFIGNLPVEMTRKTFTFYRKFVNIVFKFFKLKEPLIHLLKTHKSSHNWNINPQMQMKTNDS